jgi:hypothetical protein
MCASGSCTGGVCDPDTTDDSGSGDDSGSDGTGYPGCAHSACDTGVALTDGCDDDGDGIVSAVCEEVDSNCCTHSWTSTCVNYAEEYCLDFGCEFDPDCANE